VGGNGHKSESMTGVEGQSGGVWRVSVVGAGFRFQDRLPPYQFKEMRLPYQIGLRATVGTSADAPTVLEFNDYHAQFAQWRFFEDMNTNQTVNGSLVMVRPVFDLSRVSLAVTNRPAPPGPGIGGSWLVWLAALVVLGAGLWLYNEQRVRQGKPALRVMVEARKVVDKAKLGPAWDRLKAAAGGLALRLRAGGLGAALKRQVGGLKGLASKLRPKRAA
jgi:hypothetical protein